MWMWKRVSTLILYPLSGWAGLISKILQPAGLRSWSRKELNILGGVGVEFPRHLGVGVEFPRPLGVGVGFYGPTPTPCS